MNYLEELAYWYFRFNGYFLIHNYVNHQNAKGLIHTYETDFLGVRLPKIFEVIGGSNGDFDHNIISNNKIMCVMGESKSGYYNVEDIFRSKEVIKENIFRFGVLSYKSVTDKIVEQLFLHNSWEDKNCKIIKVLVAEKEKRNEKYIYISKETILNEFERRKVLYRKNQDRMYFNSNLVQYIFSNIEN